MKKFWALAGIIFLLGGCESFGKGVAQAFLEKEEAKDNRKCEIVGDSIIGIDGYLTQNNTVKVMMIHGVGTHTPGYSTRIRENLAKALNLTVWSNKSKQITLVNPDDEKTDIGTLVITRMQNEDLSKTMLFYELTWSGITSKEKQILLYDNSGTYSYKRAAFNNSMKAFLNDTVPDPMIYLVDKNNLILNAAKQSTCWMLSKNWKDLKYKQRAVCRVSSYDQIKNLSHENIVYITHSLGSRILLDSVIDVADQVSNLYFDPQADNAEEVQRILEILKNKEITVFMLANQLPLLQIGRPKPSVTNKIDAYCSPKSKMYKSRVFKQVKIIAFSDPNDLLSYGITQDFVDNYIDSRICPSVTNVDINIADIISAFGVGVVNPVVAHTEYDNDKRVIEIISKGTVDFQNDKILEAKCNFIKLNK